MGYTATKPLSLTNTWQHVYTRTDLCFVAIMVSKKSLVPEHPIIGSILSRKMIVGVMSTELSVVVDGTFC